MKKGAVFFLLFFLFLKPLLASAGGAGRLIIYTPKDNAVSYSGRPLFFAGRISASWRDMLNYSNIVTYSLYDSDSGKYIIKDKSIRRYWWFFNGYVDKKYLPYGNYKLIFKFINISNGTEKLIASAERVVRVRKNLLPVIKITSHKDGSRVSYKGVVLGGGVVDGDIKGIYVKFILLKQEPCPEREDAGRITPGGLGRFVRFRRPLRPGMRWKVKAEENFFPKCGKYLVVARPISVAGKWGKSASVTLHVAGNDMESPVIYDVSPADNEIIYTLAYRINFKYRDNSMINLNSIKLFIDGREVNDYYRRVNDGEASFFPLNDMNIKTLKDGRHRIRIVVKDISGNKSEKNIEYTQLAYGPSVEIIPPKRDVFQGYDSIFKVKLASKIGILNFYWSVYGGLGSEKPNGYVNEINDKEYSGEVKVRLNKPGNYFFEVAAYDLKYPQYLGAHKRIVRIPFKVLSVEGHRPPPPSVKPVKSVVNDPELIISGEKLKGTGIIVNGIKVVECNDDTAWSYLYNLAEGENNIIVKSFNSVGIESSEVPLRVFLDTQPPAIKILEPTPGALIEKLPFYVKIHVDGLEGGALFFDGKRLLVDSDGSAVAGVEIMHEGVNGFTVKAYDSAGNESSANISYRYGKVRETNYRLSVLTYIDPIDESKWPEAGSEFEAFFLLEDDAGPLAGESVNFEVVEGDARIVSDARSNTDSGGKVKVKLMLGNKVCMNKVRAYLDTGEEAYLVFVSKPSSNRSIRKVLDNGTVTYNGGIELNMLYKFCDSNGNPVEGSVISCEIVRGGGEVLNGEGKTNGSGDVIFSLMVPENVSGELEVRIFEKDNPENGIFDVIRYKAFNETYDGISALLCEKSAAVNNISYDRNVVYSEVGAFPVGKRRVSLNAVGGGFGESVGIYGLDREIKKVIGYDDFAGLWIIEYFSELGSGKIINRYYVDEDKGSIVKNESYTVTPVVSRGFSNIRSGWKEVTGGVFLPSKEIMYGMDDSGVRMKKFEVENGNWSVG